MLDTGKDTLLYSHLTEIQRAGNRAKDLTKRILAFSRHDEGEARPVLVGNVVQEALNLLRPSLPSTIEIRTAIDTKAMVFADSTQIHQIIMNLCTNAAHVMETGGGILTIELSQVDLDEEAVQTLHDLVPGPYVVLSISDTGPGIPSEIMDKIFDPYFTTKEKGKGTGLGLAVVHGIVKRYGGAITAKNRSGQGATFDLYLPRISHEPEPQTTKEALIPTGVERILYVDDEPALADLAKQMLGRLGYTVITKTSSIEALEFFKADPSRFDLIISDMTMPRMTGDKLAQQVFQIRPDIPFLLCTGFSDIIDENTALQMGISAFVQKPVANKDLASIIRRVLDNK
jgi:CheY-like chemotaxis protein